MKICKDLAETRVCKICKVEKKLNKKNFLLDKGYLSNSCNNCLILKKRPNKKCFTCKRIKNRSDFDGAKITCIQCHEKKKTQQYIDNEKKKRIISDIKYRKNNKESIAESYKKYCINNKEKRKKTCQKYNKNNLNKLREYRKKYYLKNKYALTKKRIDYINKNRDNLNLKNRIKWNTDPHYKLRKAVSLHVRNYLKSNKNGSIIKYLSYSIEELKKHLESKFEDWMTWENWGVYKIDSWNDNDKLTWTWQIDHIIPQSKFTFTSMEDEDFKNCWALENLRPYSAKMNVLEGARNDGLSMAA